MLNIRAEQMEVFERDALRRFEEEMISHSREFSPRLCEVIGDAQLRIAVRQAIHVCRRSRLDRHRRRTSACSTRRITGTAGTDTYTVSQNAAQDRVIITVGGTPTYSILKSVLPTLTFSSGGGADVLTVNYSNGDALSAFTTPLRFIASGNVDALGHRRGDV